MLVGACLETDVAALLPLEPGDRVGGDRFIGVTDVRRAVGIADRRRDVERLGHGGCPSRGFLALQGSGVGTSASIPPIWKTVAAGSSDRRGATAASWRAFE